MGYFDPPEYDEDRDCPDCYGPYPRMDHICQDWLEWQDDPQEPDPDIFCIPPPDLTEGDYDVADEIKFQELEEEWEGIVKVLRPALPADNIQQIKELFFAGKISKEDIDREFQKMHLGMLFSPKTRVI